MNNNNFKTRFGTVIEINHIVIYRLIQGRKNMTRVWVDRSLHDQGRSKNNSLTLSVTQPTNMNDGNPKTKFGIEN